MFTNIQMVIGGSNFMAIMLVVSLDTPVFLKTDKPSMGAGHVMLHRYVNGEWVQIGKSIGGNTNGGKYGQVAMSSNRIIVGFPRSTGSFFTSNGEVDVYELCNEPTRSPTNEPPRSPEDDDGGSDEGLGIIIGASVGGVVVVGGVGLYFYMTRGAASVARLTRINLGELIF